MSAADSWDKAFRDAARTLSLAQGFTLFPVEVKGPDVARALGEWLAQGGKRVTLLEPRGDEAWPRLVADLFGVAEVGEGAAVLVLGPREPPPGVYAGLRLLNQRRDTIARHLACPLLWCGPPEFLKLTWERAPDFWSVRALPIHLDVPSGRASEPPMWGGAWVGSPPELLRALLDSAEKQGDARNAARAAAMLADTLTQRGELEDAEEALDDSEALRLVAPETRLTRATLAALRGERGRAEELLAEPFDEPALEGRRMLALGALHLSGPERDVERAKGLLLRAVEILRAAGDRGNEAVAIADLGVAELPDDLETAEARLRRALAIFQELGDERNEARALAKLGAVHLAARDSRQACTHFEDALAAFRDLGDRHGEADVLRRLARAYLELGDPERALLDSERAIVLSDALGDEGGREEAAALSERAHAELDEKP